MINSCSTLLEEIREKCRQQHWYGPDMSNPASLQEKSRAMPGVEIAWYDARGKASLIHPDDDLSRLPIPQQFAVPPATQEQVRETECLLGFSLYPFLRELYTQVANGGFGPGYGLNGIIGGFENGGLGPMVERYREEKSSARQRKTDPVQRIELCHWGCAIYSYLENKTGRIYHMERNGKYQCDAPSLEVWLECWIADEHLDPS